MAYARWPGWYAFYASQEDESDDGQVMALWLDRDRRLMHHRADVLRQASPEWVMSTYPGTTLQEAEEAMEYITEFLEDVESRRLR